MVKEMFLHEETVPVPDWQDINLIIRDLRGVMDTIDDGDTENRQFRPAIARTIAMMREEKTRDGQLRMARDLARQLCRFKFRAGGLLEGMECNEALERLTYMAV